MNNEYDIYSNYGQWETENQVSLAKIPRLHQHWLSDRGSLTSALVRLSTGSFRVKVLRQRIAIPKWHEQKKLNAALHLAAMIREVELLIYDEPVVYARSIIPLDLVRMGKASLGGLGSAPLGKFLFDAGQIRISKREIATISLSDKTTYGRRTPYDYKGSTVLVSEFFLSEFDKYL